MNKNGASGLIPYYKSSSFMNFYPSFMDLDMDLDMTLRINEHDQEFYDV